MTKPEFSSRLLRPKSSSPTRLPAMQPNSGSPPKIEVFSLLILETRLRLHDCCNPIFLFFFLS
ncbi:hypothetical protein RchiOBHm_Chr6g0295351 [Rosa chinensis]|uniref:Uncharacterized protein n=1 Tax=Rosa chinensis TaxID=74649 RepID=A0A2P6PX52_ROSCH|nr:hypothetical protein RchiOBHm_Chr6g0295351 [Rosa chinensis]